MILTKAPLIEVVFELRWRVVKTDPQLNFGYDPNFVPFSNAFKLAVREHGFDTMDNLIQSGPTLVYGVVNRFRQGSRPFPLFQIGHGIFACNVSTDYVWPSFKQLMKLGMETVLSSYPRNEHSPLRVCHVELRYVDAFNKLQLGHNSVETFLKDHSNFKYEGLGFLHSEPFDGPATGMVALSYPLKNASLGRFEVAVGTSILGDGGSGIILTSKVINDNCEQINLGDLDDCFVAVESWADAAHDITSQFFREFIDEKLMQAFKQE